MQHAHLDHFNQVIRVFVFGAVLLGVVGWCGAHTECLGMPCSLEGQGETRHGNTATCGGSREGETWGHHDTLLAR